MATVIRTAMHHTAPAMATLRTAMDTAPTTVIPHTVLDTAPATVILRTVLDTVLGIPTDPTVLDTATPTMVIDPHIPTTAPHMGTIVRGVGAVGEDLRLRGLHRIIVHFIYERHLFPL